MSKHRTENVIYILKTVPQNYLRSQKTNSISAATPQSRTVRPGRFRITSRKTPDLTSQSCIPPLARVLSQLRREKANDLAIQAGLAKSLMYRPVATSLCACSAMWSVCIAELRLTPIATRQLFAEIPVRKVFLYCTSALSPVSYPRPPGECCAGIAPVTKPPWLPAPPPGPPGRPRES